MTADQFRKLALSLPEAIESSHMNHPDFRIGGKIFATLAGGDAWGMVKLSPADQTDFTNQAPQIFEAFDNAWGRAGCTKVHLKAAKKKIVQEALHAAWKNTAPAKILKKLEEE